MNDIPIAGDIFRLARYLSEQHVLLTTQTTIQDAVTQLRAAERNRHITFIVDTACQGTRAILHEVTLTPPFYSAVADDSEGN
jgi:hypothetical protein